MIPGNCIKFKPLMGGSGGEMGKWGDGGRAMGHWGGAWKSGYWSLVIGE